VRLGRTFVFGLHTKENKKNIFKLMFFAALVRIYMQRNE